MVTYRWISTLLPGTPPSVNELPLDTRSHKYRRVRNQWINDLCMAFNESGNVLPRDLKHVRVHALLWFPIRRRRDSGNYKALLEKFTGDALQVNHIADDTHDIYSFGNVSIYTEPDRPAGHLIVIEYQR